MMKDFKKNKTLKEKIKHLLEKNEDLRDDDMKLLSFFYFYEIGEEEIKEMLAIDLLTKISKNLLPNFESIRRIRQSVQKDNLSLRGKQYGKKKKKEKIDFLKINIKN